MYGAVQELADLVDGNFDDVYNSQHEIKGCLHDLIQFKAAWFRLQFGDAGKAEADKILEARRQRKVGWIAADKAQQNKGEGSSKKKD
jgi:hypothetical protein